MLDSVLGVLGAFLMVVSLFTSPLTQQAVRFPTHLAPVEGNASIPHVIDLVGNLPLNVLYSGESDSLCSACLPLSRLANIRHVASSIAVIDIKRNILSGFYNMPSVAVARCTGASRDSVFASQKESRTGRRSREWWI